MRILLVVGAGLFLCPGSGFADDDTNYLYLSAGSDGVGGAREQTSAGAPLSDSASGTYGFGTVTAYLGACDFSGTSYGESEYTENGYYINGHSGSFSPIAQSSRTLTITTDDPGLDGTVGVFRITYRIDGSYLPYSSQHSRDLLKVQTNNNVYLAGSVDGETWPGSIPGSITDSVNLSLSSAGSQFGAYLLVSSIIYAEPPEYTGHTVTSMNVSVYPGSMQLLDADGNSISFHCSSSTGSASAKPVASGTSFVGTALTNTVAHQSTVSLIGGNASADQYVQMTFSPPAGPSGILVSDAVDLSGTGFDPVVVQISYDEAAAMSVFGRVDDLGLVWRDPASGVWRNAVDGNTGGTPRAVKGPYNPAANITVGSYGLDETAKVVWAVVNHNSRFAVSSLQAVKVPSVTHLANGHFYFQLANVPNAINRIEASTDLSAPGSFQTLSSVLTGPTGACSFEDMDAGNFSKRFYRLAAP